MKSIRKVAAALVVLAACVGTAFAATRAESVEGHSRDVCAAHVHDGFDCDGHSHDFFAEDAHFDGESEAVLVSKPVYDRPCPSCGGKKICQKCNGNGKCTVCKGKGKMYGGKCYQCLGKKKCNYCGGKKKCGECNGKGTVRR